AEVETVETVYIKRLHADFTVKAITNDELNQITDEAKDGNGVLNESKISALVVAAACVDPDFKDASLRERYDSMTAAEVVNKALLAGELARLSQKIMEISGFKEDVESAKN